MSSRGEIYSTRLDSENRTYFFNIKENRRGDMFLNIVESNKKDNKFERYQVMVYEDELAQFMEKLNKAAAIILKKEEIAKSSHSSHDFPDNRRPYSDNRRPYSDRTKRD